MEASQAWQAVLGQLQMEMPKATYDTWVRDTQFVAYEDGAFVIGAQNAYARDWLEGRLTSTVSQLLNDILNRTETAMPQAHCFLVSELAIRAEIGAVRLGNLG